MSREGPDYAALNGWDRDYPRFPDEDRPVYVGSTTFGKRPLVEDAEELRARRADVAIVGAPFDDAEFETTTAGLTAMIGKDIGELKAWLLDSDIDVRPPESIT